MGRKEKIGHHFYEVLRDEDPVAKLKIPDYLVGRIPIIGRYYGEEFKKTLSVAKALDSLGYSTYPDPNPRTTTIISETGDTFNFLGGDKMVEPPFMVQLGFFRLIKESDKDEKRNFCYVAIQAGYLGRTASLEVAYSMATKKKLIFSEMPTRFSTELSNGIVSLIEENCHRYPVVATDDVEAQLTEVQQREIQYPLVSDGQRREIYSAITELERDLRKKFGFKID